MCSLGAGDSKIIQPHLLSGLIECIVWRWTGVLLISTYQLRTYSERSINRVIIIQINKCESPGGLHNGDFPELKDYLGEFGNGKGVPGRGNSKYKILETRLNMLPWGRRS